MTILIRNVPLAPAFTVVSGLTVALRNDIVRGDLSGAATEKSVDQAAHSHNICRRTRFLKQPNTIYEMDSAPRSRKVN